MISEKIKRPTGRAIRLVSVLLSLILLTGFSPPMQPRNLLKTPIANQKTSLQNWVAVGDAKLEEFDGILCYVVRNGGHFRQEVKLPPEAAGQYIVVIGRGSSERVDPKGAITGLPYIYGYVLGEGEPMKEIILGNLESSYLIGRGRANEWVKMFAIFKIPQIAKGVRYIIGQAQQPDVPQTGSAVRFDDLGLYFFSSPYDAQVFINKY